MGLPEIQYYHHGQFTLSGGVLLDAITAYQTYGDPKNPCIVFPSCYGAKLALGGELPMHLLSPKTYDTWQIKNIWWEKAR